MLLTLFQGNQAMLVALQGEKNVVFFLRLIESTEHGEIDINSAARIAKEIGLSAYKVMENNEKEEDP